jgi:hypothetical protein
MAVQTAIPWAIPDAVAALALLVKPADHPQDAAAKAAGRTIWRAIESAALR